MPDNSFVLKACDKTLYRLFKYRIQIQRTLSLHLSHFLTYTQTHMFIFYGVHARLQLLYRILLDLDHRGWNRARESHMQYKMWRQTFISQPPAQHCMRDLLGQLCELCWGRKP